MLCYGYAACCFDSFFFIFAISRIITFFKTIRDMLFQCSVQRLFSVDELIVLLEENTARNPEFIIIIIIIIIIVIIISIYIALSQLLLYSALQYLLYD